MRILVTGASGFIGRPLVKRLVHSSHEVVGTYLGSSRGLARIGAVDCREIDLLDGGAMGRLVDEFEPEVAVHLAARSHVGSSWEEIPAYYRVNVDGTAVLLDALDGIPMLVASSCEVYGCVPEEEQPIGEDRAAAPANPYALTKAVTERLATRSGGTVARLFTVVGPGQEEPFALPSFARQLGAIRAGEAEPILAVGNLAARRDFVHLDDAVRALAVLAEGLRDREPDVFNIATGVAHSVRQALELLIDVAGVEVVIARDEARMRPVDVPLYLGRTERLEAATGWRPRKDLRSAVADLWSRALEDREATVR